jgi:hypothetical protein
MASKRKYRKMKEIVEIFKSQSISEGFFPHEQKNQRFRGCHHRKLQKQNKKILYERKLTILNNFMH